MNVKVLHKVDTNFRLFDPLKDTLTLVDEFEFPGMKRGWGIADPHNGHELRVDGSDEACLEHVWRIHNAVEGWERNVQLRIRSLSVGDVVDLDGRSYGS